MVLEVLKRLKTAFVRKDETHAIELITSAENEARQLLFKVIPREAQALHKLVKELELFREWIIAGKIRTGGLYPSNFDWLIDEAKKVDFEALRTLKTERK